MGSILSTNDDTDTITIPKEKWNIIRNYLLQEVNRKKSFDDNIKKLLDKREETDNACEKYHQELQQRTIEFTKDKTSEQLKDYLATVSIAYNLWKDADHAELVKLVHEYYE